LGHSSSLTKSRCNALTDFLFEPFGMTIAYAHPDIAGKRVGENNTQLISWHWHGDDESILLIVSFIVDMTILPTANALTAGLPDPNTKI